MGIKEGALALADELEAFEDGDCEECIAYGQPECKGHLSCAEIIARYSARKVREAVERDGEGATTVSAYDLLSEGEREVLRMWPRYEDCEPVRFGDRVKYRRGTCVVESVRLYIGGGVSVYGNDNGKKAVVTEQAFRDQVERADAQVLAADGEPLEVGQTVYHTDTGREYQIHSINDDGKGAFVYNNSLGQDASGLHLCSVGNLTHQRPVLDADGVPIKVGDTVYLLPGEWCGAYPLLYYSAGDEMVVKELNPDHDVEGVLKCVGDGKCACFPLPYQLTHTKPEQDSWERIEEDASLAPGDYIKKCGRKTDLYAYQEMPIDLVRRCRALAEKENKNE